MKKATRGSVAHIRRVARKSAFKRILENTVKPLSTEQSEAEEKIKTALLKTAGRHASRKAMKTMGFIIAQEGEWIVKRFKSGYTRKLKKIDKVSLPKQINLG